MKVPAAAVGKAVKCVRCGKKLTITKDGARLAGRAAPENGQGPLRENEEDLRESKSASRRLVGELLIEDGLIDAEQLQEALRIQAERGGKTFEILLELGHLSKDDLHKFLSKQSGLAGIDLKNCDIPQEVIDLVPKEFAQEHVVLPIDKLRTLLTVGMACPLDTATIAELERITGLKVKAMLCRFDDINVAIRRYYPSETPEEGVAGLPEPTRPRPQERPPKPDAARRDQVAKLLSQLDVLPLLPGTIQEVSQALGVPENATRDVADIAGTDPALAARILSVANFPAYGMPDKIMDISEAVTLLGPDGVSTIASALEQAQGIAESAHFDFAAFRLRSAFCATVAMTLAKETGRSNIPEAYTSGLLHEIGRLALAAALPDDYANVSGRNLPVAEQIEAEERTFGLAHPEAGHILALHWRIPSALAESIRFHHDSNCIGQESELPEDTHLRDLAAVVALATALTEAFEQGPEASAGHIEKYADLLAYLGLEEDAAAQILENTASAFRGATSK